MYSFQLIELQYHRERSLGKLVGTTLVVEVETVALKGLHFSVGMLRYALAKLCHWLSGNTPK